MCSVEWPDIKTLKAIKTLIRYFMDYKILCYFWRISQNSLPVFKTASPPTFTIPGNKTRKSDGQGRHRTFILENCLTMRGADFGTHTALSILMQHPNKIITR